MLTLAFYAFIWITYRQDKAYYANAIDELTSLRVTLDRCIILNDGAINIYVNEYDKCIEISEDCKRYYFYEDFEKLQKNDGLILFFKRNEIKWNKVKTLGVEVRSKMILDYNIVIERSLNSKEDFIMLIISALAVSFSIMMLVSDDDDLYGFAGSEYELMNNEAKFIEGQRRVKFKGLIASAVVLIITFILYLYF